MSFLKLFVNQIHGLWKPLRKCNRFHEEEDHVTRCLYARIRANPKYQHLVKTRNGYGKIMTIIMFIVYYGYISLIAFDKELLATPLGSSGVTTLGVPIGMGVIVFTVVITLSTSVAPTANSTR